MTMLKHIRLLMIGEVTVAFFISLTCEGERENCGQSQSMPPCCLWFSVTSSASSSDASYRESSGPVHNNIAIIQDNAVTEQFSARETSGSPQWRRKLWHHRVFWRVGMWTALTATNP